MKAFIGDELNGLGSVSRYELIEINTEVRDVSVGDVLFDEMGVYIVEKFVQLSDGSYPIVKPQ